MEDTSQSKAWKFKILGRQDNNCHFHIFATANKRASFLAFPTTRSQRKDQEKHLKMSSEEIDYEMSSDEEKKNRKSDKTKSIAVYSDEEENRKSDKFNSDDEDGEEKEEPRIANQKRTHSDKSDSEPESNRVTRKTKVQKCSVSNDAIVADTLTAFAFITRRLDDEVFVYQSDIETFKKLQNMLDMGGIHGYHGSEEQIIRLLHLYKYKRLCRDGTRAKTHKLCDMKATTLQTSWNSMTELLRRGSYEYEKFCTKKEYQRERMANHGLGLKKIVHNATVQRAGCLVFKEEGKCNECIEQGVENTQNDMLSYQIDYKELNGDEYIAVIQFERMIDKGRKAKYARATTSASPRKTLSLRGYLPEGQHEEAKSLGQAGSHANERDTQSHGTSYDYDSPYDDQQSYRQSNAHRRENPREVEGQDAGRRISDRHYDELSCDLDNAWKRIRALESRIETIAESQSASASQMTSVVSNDFEKRLCRLEARVAESGQNGAEQREKLSSRVTECQATLLRFESRFANLDSQTTKIVQGNESLERKRREQRLELERVIDHAEALTRRLKLQKKSIDQVLDVVVEKARELPAVMTFRDSQEREKMMDAIQKARRTDDNA